MEKRAIAITRLSSIGAARLGGRFAGIGGALLIALALGTSLVFTYVASQGRDYGDYFIPLLLANGLAVIFLLSLILFNAWVLWKQWQTGILGSRLAVRIALLVGVLTVTPATVVFGFSWQFLSRGVDSWFSMEVRDALDHAILVGQNSIDGSRLATLDNAKQAARALNKADEAYLPQVLEVLRDQFHLSQITLLDRRGVLVADVFQPLAGNSLFRPEELRELLRHAQPYARVEPDARGSLIVKALMPVRRPNGRYWLYLAQPIPQQVAAAMEGMQSAYKRYQRLELLRKPMKTAFELSLISVLLVSALSALWLALFLSRRLASPVGHLAAGTRAVARGVFAPIEPHGLADDELGILVHSFNSMIQQLDQAQRGATTARLQADERRAFVETILGHLSTGVMAFDMSGHLSVANSAAAQILRVPLDVDPGTAISDLAARHPELGPVFNWLAERLKSPLQERQQELVLERSQGNQTLLLRCAPLPPSGAEPDYGEPAGILWVFDDISVLIQGQRAAAWSEVARRLAHEIKNPLTPIQLSAERLRRKYLDELGPAGELLDRATRTIINQVETLKVMVDAFSEYARQPQLRMVPVDLNALINEVLDLYREPGQHKTGQLARGIHLESDLDLQLPALQADPDRLRQVLHNLLRNALDALPDDHHITLRSRLRRDHGTSWVDLEVLDDGPGFPPDMLERVFEPYVTSKAKGTGLGLAIVKKIVEEHAGQIRAENRAEQGARVWISLPI